MTVLLLAAALVAGLLPVRAGADAAGRMRFAYALWLYRVPHQRNFDGYLAVAMRHDDAPSTSSGWAFLLHGECRFHQEDAGGWTVICGVHDLWVSRKAPPLEVDPTFGSATLSAGHDTVAWVAQGPPGAAEPSDDPARGKEHGLLVFRDSEAAGRLFGRTVQPTGRGKFLSGFLTGVDVATSEAAALGIDVARIAPGVLRVRLP